MRLETGIDFLSFTLKTGGLPLAFKILGDTPEPLVSFDRGLYGYKSSFKCAGVSVLYSPDRNDVHIQLTGTACAFYGDKLLSMVPADAGVSRIDIRCDVLGGLMSVEEIWGYLRRRCYAGNTRSIQLIESRKSDEYAGATVYLGAPSSDVRCRIYDKGAEQKTTNDPRRWVRYEFQMRRDAAAFAYSDCISRGTAETFLSFLKKTIRLTERSSDTVSQANRNRLRTLKKWAATFRQKVATVYHTQRRSPSFTGMMNHLKNCGAILKTLRNLRSDFEEIIHSFADQAEIKEKHMLLAYELRPCSS